MDNFIEGLTAKAQSAANTTRDLFKNITTSALPKQDFDLDEISESFSKSFQDMLSNNVITKVVTGAMSESMKNIGLAEGSLTNLLNYFEPVPSVTTPKTSNILALDGKISLPTLYLGNKLDDIIKALGIKSSTVSLSKTKSPLLQTKSDKDLKAPISKGKSSLLEGLNLFKNVALVVGTFVVSALLIQSFGVGLSAILKVGVIFGLVATIIKIVPLVMRGVSLSVFLEFALAASLISLGIMAISLVSRFMPVKILSLIKQILAISTLIWIIGTVINPSVLAGAGTFALSGALIGFGLVGFSLGLKAISGVKNILNVIVILTVITVFMYAIGPGALLALPAGIGLMAVGIGLLSMSLALDAINKLSGDNLKENLTTIVLFTAAIGLVGMFFGLGLVASGLGMLFLGVGLLSMYYGLEKFSTLKLDNSIFNLLLVLAAFIGTIGLIGMVFGTGLVSAGLGMIFIGIGLLSMAKGLDAIDKVSASSGLVKILVTMSVFLGVLAVVGTFLIPAGVGLILVGLGLVSMAMGFKQISKSTENMEDLKSILIVMSVFLLAMAIVGLLSPLIALAGYAMIVIGLSFLVFGLGLWKIASVGEEGFNTIKNGIIGIGEAFLTYGNGKVALGTIVFLVAAASLWVLGKAMEHLLTFDSDSILNFINGFSTAVLKFNEPGVLKGALGLFGAGLGLISMSKAIKDIDGTKLGTFAEGLGAIGDAFKKFSLRDTLFAAIGPSISAAANAMKIAADVGTSALPQFIKDLATSVSSITNFGQFKSRLKTVSKGMKDLANSIKYLEDSAEFLSKGDVSLTSKQSAQFINSNKDSVTELKLLNTKLDTVIGIMNIETGKEGEISTTEQTGFSAKDISSGMDFEGMASSMLPDF